MADTFTNNLNFKSLLLLVYSDLYGLDLYCFDLRVGMMGVGLGSWLCTMLRRGMLACS